MAALWPQEQQNKNVVYKTKNSRYEDMFMILNDIHIQLKTILKTKH